MRRSFVLNELTRNLLGTQCRVERLSGGAKLNISTPPQLHGRLAPPDVGARGANDVALGAHARCGDFPGAPRSFGEGRVLALVSCFAATPRSRAFFLSSDNPTSPPPARRGERRTAEGPWAPRVRPRLTLARWRFEIVKRRLWTFAEGLEGVQVGQAGSGKGSV